MQAVHAVHASFLLRREGRASHREGIPSGEHRIVVAMRVALLEAKTPGGLGADMVEASRARTRVPNAALRPRDGLTLALAAGGSPDMLTCSPFV